MHNRAKDLIISKKDYILDLYKINGRNPSTDKKIINEFKTVLLDYDDYESKTKAFSSYMKSKEKELTNLEKAKRNEVDKLNIVTDELNDYIVYLKKEKEILSSITSKTNSYQKSFKKLADNYSSTSKKFENILINIDNYNNNLKLKQQKEEEKLKILFNGILDKEKTNIENFFTKTKTYQFIEENYIKEKNNLDKEKKKKMLFDWHLFIKYSLLLGIVFSVAIIDFFLVQDIVLQEYDKDINRIFGLEKFIYGYVIPFLPSFVLIFGEFILNSILKDINKIIKYIIHFLFLSTIIFIIGLVAFSIEIQPNFTIIMVEQLAVFDLIVRIILFGIAIPLSILSLVKLFKFNDFVIYIKQTLGFPFRLFIWIQYLFELNFLKNKKDNFFENQLTYKISFDNLKKNISNSEKEINLINKKNNLFIKDIEETNIIINSINISLNNLKNFLLGDTKNSIENLGFSDKGKLLFSSWDSSKLDLDLKGLLESKLFNIKYILEEAFSTILKNKNNIENKYELQINNIKNKMSIATTRRKKYKTEFENNEKDIISGLFEGIKDI